MNPTDIKKGSAENLRMRLCFRIGAFDETAGFIMREQSDYHKSDLHTESCDGYVSIRFLLENIFTQRRLGEAPKN
jgi:hypothetical protein